MARKFLYTIAFLIFLVVGGAFAYRLFGPQLMRIAMVPSADFIKQKPMPAYAWNDRRMWFARPDIPGNPALWTPDGFHAEAKKGDAAVFFIHPTSYLDRFAWNAPLDDAEANDRAQLFIRGQASAFNGVGEIWAPRYRQATFGAFLTGQKESGLALTAAYTDVVAAWDAFLAAVPSGKPIILAAHSQGSVHLLRLLREQIAGKPVAGRIAAAYVVGWPVSMTADVPTLGLPACAAADQSGCIVSWQSFAEPADISQIQAAYDASVGPTGIKRRGTKILCTNPVTGTQNAAAPATANKGTIVPSLDMKTGTFEMGAVPARCSTSGYLLIGEAPAGIGTYVLPGNNYHVFDYSLFWGDVRADAARRLASFKAHK
ncbi:DUF3089 domain-containing protein [Sphingomonas sp.]|uniref:DUF3089 domain-containing protein n=1 Tax=Sphingomonas sp. TaxID=28214 RepID=UPI0026014055|nr:DUF3089 domain-containing protein [Sphingomonas sp.]